MEITNFTFGDSIAITDINGIIKQGFILSYSFSKTMTGELLPETQTACIVKGTLMSPEKRDSFDCLWEDVYDIEKIESVKELLFEKAFIKKIYDYSSLNENTLC
jgi:hypothetical protein